MRTKTPPSTVRVLSFLLISVATAAAQQGVPVHFSGPINDYSPASVKGGPWEMHGQWSLDIHRESGTADFFADMTMSDYGTTGGIVDATIAGQNPHTHHIKLTSAEIVWDMTGCPPVSPAAKMGFHLSGTVTLLTGNGSNAPFETTPPSSTLQVCVTGGDEIPYSFPNSNITMVFGAPATGHFGTQPIHGAVRVASADPRGDN